MSKELMQKIVEAGIVPEQAVKQLKVWKQLPDDISDEERPNATQQQLVEYVQAIAGLLESDGELPELRETQPGLEAVFEAKKQDCIVVVVMAQAMTASIQVLAARHATDILSCIVFKADQYGALAARTGNQVSLDGGVVVYEITEATPLYRGEEVAFYRCGVQEVPNHAQMPELR